MGRRMLISLSSFYVAGIVALAGMSDPGSVAHIDALWWLLVMAALGVLFGPITFVASVHGLICGYGSGTPTSYAWVWVSLAYAGYIGLFVGSILFKGQKLRIACLIIEALCALVAAKGVAFCI